jgi:hypothetical protein
VQPVQFGTIGTALGAVGGLAAATFVTGGMAPLVAAAAYTASAVVGGLLVGQAGRMLDYSDLKSMDGLARFQRAHGGDTQGTLAFVHAGDGNYYMIEQQTNNRVGAAAAERGITYIPQGRDSGHHAEVRFIDWAKGRKILKNSVIWVSKPVCGDCAVALESEGVTIKTAINVNDRYRNWKAPTGTSRPVNSTGVFKGRRTEAQVLQDETPQHMKIG